MLARGAEAMYVTKTAVMIRKTIPVSSVFSGWLGSLLL